MGNFGRGGVAAALRSGTTDPSAGYALYLPFSAASPTYRVGATTYSRASSLPGYSYTRSGGKGEIEASDRTGFYDVQELPNSEFTADVSGWTASGGAGLAWQAANSGQLLYTKNADGDAVGTGANGRITFGKYRVQARVTVSERVRISSTGLVGPAASGYLFIASAPGTYDIDVIGTSIYGFGNLDVNIQAADLSAYAANGATIAVEFLRISRAFSRINYVPVNEPAIVPGVGYWSRGALTNSILRSQEFSNASWSYVGASVTADTTVAPDGTTTADTLTATGTAEAIAFQTLSGVSSGAVHTVSCFYPSGGTAAYGMCQLNLTAGILAITFNRTTGVVNAQFTVAGAPPAVVGYTVAVAGGWRFNVVYTPDSAAPLAAFGFSSSAAARTSAVGMTCPLWQGQHILGNHPAGGPIIPTAGATAPIGADALSVDVAVASTDDFIIEARIFAPPLGVANDESLFALIGATVSRKLSVNSGGDLVLWRDGNAFALSLTTTVKLNSNLASVIYRRKAGQDSLAYRCGGTTQIGAEVATVFGSSATTFLSGYAFFPLDGRVLHEAIKIGTFSDAQLTARLLELDAI